MDVEKITIRDATVQDADVLAPLLNQLGYPSSSQEVVHRIASYQAPDYRLLVSEVEGAVNGFIALHVFHLLHWRGKMGRITAFCVDEQYRLQGVGLRLLEAAEQGMWSCGCAKLEVSSNDQRKRTHQFYLKMGYKVDSLRFVKYPPTLP